MNRKRIVLLFTLVALLVPWTVSSVGAQTSQVTVAFHCFTTEDLQYRAGLTATNHTNQDVQIVISTVDQNGAAFPISTGVGQKFISAGQTLDRPNLLPLSPPYNGWRVQIGFPNDEDPWNFPHEWLFEETYTEGECSVTDDGPPPTMTPPTPTPTQTLVPTATLTPEQTPTPVPNSFSLVSAQRMCADQSFVATWSGANVTVVEFSITNTSDEWTSGWVAGDPASTTFTMDVDHHNYDKAAARATFEDGTTSEAFMDIGNCTEAPAPPPPPAIVDPPAAAPVVSSLPSTGSGSSSASLVTIATLVAAASVLISTGVRRQHQ